MASALAHIDQLGAGPGLVQQLGSDQPVVHHDVGSAQQLETASGDEPGIARTAADQVHGAGDYPGRPATPPREPGRRRRMPAREIHDQIHHARQRADRVIDHDAAASRAAGDRQLARLQAERGRDIVRTRGRRRR